MKIFIVVPVFDEGSNLSLFLGDLVKSKYKIVVVDDGSSDNTHKIASKYKIDLLRHPVNLGKGAAMKTGALYSFDLGADWVIFMDGDGQHKVSDLHKFRKILTNSGVDVVLGKRIFGKSAPKDRVSGNKFASALINLLFGVKVGDLLCGFRAISKAGFKKLFWSSTRYGVETEMVVRIAKNKVKYKEVEVEGVYIDNVKGVSMLDALGILFDVIKWRIGL